MKIKFYWNPVSPVRFRGICGRSQVASAEPHGGWDRGPLSLWVFLILSLWPLKGNVPSAGAVDAGRGCSGRWVLEKP